MKLKHWILLGFAAVGVLGVLHVYMSHGGVAGVKQMVGVAS